MTSPMRAVFVSAHGVDGFGEGRVAEDVQQGGDGRMVQVFGGADEVVLLHADGNEVSFQGAGGGADPQGGVGHAAVHVGGHGQVGVLLAVVTLDCRRVDAFGGQQVIQEHAGAGAALAVDEAHVGAGQVLQRAEAPWIAARDDQALLAPGRSGSG